MRPLPWLPALLSLGACGGQLDAGFDEPHGLLPVDERSPLAVINDGGLDNWQAEYAALLAGTGGVQWIALVVNANPQYPSIETNIGNFRKLVNAGRESGLHGLPDPVASISSPLVQPASGRVEDTVPNRSEGARLLVQLAQERGTAAHPLAIATGGALTDVADAYLLDPALAERVVVVASLGMSTDTGARLATPNGERDPWANTIVATRLRYVQVNGYYDQLLDVPDDRVSELPSNAFGKWMTDKRSSLLSTPVASDQLSVLASALPWFASTVAKVRVDSEDSTVLVDDPSGPDWHVPKCDTDRAREELWRMLLDPKTFQ